MDAGKKSFLFKAIIILGVLFLFIGIANLIPSLSTSRVTGKGSGSILALKLKGVLLDKDKFLEHLRDYSKIKSIKGILIRLDSPGGSVALSQEIYMEFKRIREQLKKPVVVSVGSIMASGALYAAAAADFIVVQSGTLVGSIGVIVPLMNMERLYDWAKLEPYSIKTGEFKDIGSPYRPMTSNERVLFQDLTNNLLEQFKKHLKEGRNMSEEDLEPYTDARVFTGETAVSVGFADKIGTYSDAIEEIGRLTSLGKQPHLFTPQPKYWDQILSGRFGDSVSSLALYFKRLMNFSPLGSLLLQAQPLYIFPPAIGILQ